MLNQAWWTRLAVFNMSHQKLVRTLESFFAPNRSQSESEKNDTEEEQCINQEKRMRIEGNRKNHKLSIKLGCEITRGRSMKRKRCSAIFVGNLRRQTPLHWQKGVQILEPQLCKDIKTVSLFLYYKDQVKKMFLLACLYECKKKILNKN